MTKRTYLLQGLRGVNVSNISFTGSFSATIIDNNFIDDYMAEAPSPIFSLIYIYAYRCAMFGVSVSNSDIAKKFKILESDVIKAWKYWKAIGLINIVGNKENPCIEFLKSNKNMEEVAAIEDNKVKVVVAKPVFNPSDIADILNKNPEVGDLLRMAEGQKGKPVTSKETEIIVWMYESLELPFEVIFMLLSFCYKNNKPPRYMEKTALDWIEKGILTTEAASGYLSFYNNYGKVLKYFGVADRAVTQNEKVYIDKWISEWKMPFELIELAATRTVTNTGKAAFSYCNKILEKWHSAGYTNVSEVESAEADYINKNNKLKEVSKQPKGTFNNYNQRIYSNEELEEIVKRKGN